MWCHSTCTLACLPTASLAWATRPSAPFTTRAHRSAPGASRTGATRRPQHGQGIVRLLPSWRDCSLHWPPGAAWGCLGLPRAASGCLGLPPLRAPGCVTHPGRTRDEPPSRAAPKPRPKVANWPKVADSERATRRCPTCRCVPWASRTSAPRSGGTSAGAAAGCATAAERMPRAPIRSVACAMHVCTASHTACACVCACVLHVHVHGLARSPSPQRQTPPTLTPTITLVHVSPWADWLHRLRLFHLRPPPLLQGGHRRWGVLPRAERDAARAAKQNGRGQAGG